jgi:hypothetical protein
MIAERFCGYKHWTLETTPRCFYVGKGLKKRPFNHKNRNHKWCAITGRLGLRVEVCVESLTNFDACAWEIEQIAQEKTYSTNHSHDDLVDVGCNFTRGGEGGSRIKSAEEREKIRVSKLGTNLSSETLKKRSNALTGQKRSGAVRQKLSELKKQHYVEHPVSDETCQRNSEAAKRQWQDPEIRRKMLESRAQSRLAKIKAL